MKGRADDIVRAGKERVLPAPSTPDFEKLNRLCAKYRIDVLGPPPE